MMTVGSGKAKTLADGGINPFRPEELRLPADLLAPKHDAQSVLDAACQLNAALEGAVRLGWIVTINLESPEATNAPCKICAKISKEI